MIFRLEPVGWDMFSRFLEGKPPPTSPNSARRLQARMVPTSAEKAGGGKSQV